MGERVRHPGETELGRRIRELREGVGWPQKQLAREARISQGYLSLLESGKVENPSINALLRIAFALSADPDEISEAKRRRSHGTGK